MKLKNNSHSDFPDLPAKTIVPKHLVIIPDGNRRWAKEHNLPTFEGHRRGFDITPKIAKAARHFGVHTLTIWAFSTENWNRAKEEIKYLMKLYEWFLDKHLEEAQKDGVRIIHFGRKNRLPKTLAFKLQKTEEMTKNNKKNILNIALDYGGRDELIRSVKKMLADGLKPGNLNEKTFLKYLDTGDQPYPYPDLIIRTSGEQRLSGILPFQTVYAELYFEKGHFPDYTPEKLLEAILDYSGRERRFGGDSAKRGKVKRGIIQKAIFEIAKSL